MFMLLLLLLFWIKFLDGDNHQTVYSVMCILSSSYPLFHYIENILFFVTVS